MNAGRVATPALFLPQTEVVRARAIAGLTAFGMRKLLAFLPGKDADSLRRQLRERRGFGLFKKVADDK